MEITLTLAAYIWVGYCAISHVRIDAKKRNKGTSFAEQKFDYIVQILIYWAFISFILSV
jgi:hypothetical protein